jgi:hypothetical protein
MGWSLARGAQLLCLVAAASAAALRGTSRFLPAPAAPGELTTAPRYPVPKGGGGPASSADGFGWDRPPQSPLEAGLVPNQYPEKMVRTRARAAPGTRGALTGKRTQRDPRAAQFPQLGPYNLLKGPGMDRNPELPAGYNEKTTSSPAKDQTVQGARVPAHSHTR